MMFLLIFWQYEALLQLFSKINDEKFLCFVCMCESEEEIHYIAKSIGSPPSN